MKPHAITWALLGFLLGSSLLLSAEVPRRFTLTIEGISEQPRTFDISGIGFEIGTVEVDNGTAIITQAAVPGSAKAQGVSFFLPEVDDEVLVSFYHWQRRIMSGTPEPHSADIVAYGPAGKVVNRWHLTNAWPSKIALPSYDAESSEARRSEITLQVDNITRATSDGLAPWPDVRSTRIDPINRTFTLSWNSAPGATYDVYGWDPVKKRPVKIAENRVAESDLSFITRRMEAGKGIYYVVLTSPPPPPTPAPAR